MRSKKELPSTEKLKITTHTSKNPLYIIDGKEATVEESKAIDPNLIESIDVFKDKTALKKYGEKGKNGVIVITLKK